MDAEGEVERLEEPGVVDDFKERVSRHNRIDINSETMTAGTRPTHVHARQNPNKEKGKWVQSPAPSQEATDCLLGGGISFPQWNDTGAVPTLHPNPMLSRWTTQTRLRGEGKNMKLSG